MASKSVETEFDSKWSTLHGIYSSQNLSPGPFYQVWKMDRQRVQDGEYPLSYTETVQALKSAYTGSAPEAPPQGGGLNPLPNIFGDVKNAATGLMGLIGSGLHGLVRDVNPASLFESKPGQEAPFLQQVGAVTSGLNEALKGIEGKAPPVYDQPFVQQWVPGAYVASQIVHHPSQLASHPVTALLDVLPAAKGVGQAAGALAKVGITDEASQAIQDAANLKPNDYSPEARAIRASVKTNVSRPRELALASKKGLLHLVRESALGGGGQAVVAPAGLNDLLEQQYQYQWIGTRGEKLANFLNKVSKGEVGQITAGAAEHTNHLVAQMLRQIPSIGDARRESSPLSILRRYDLESDPQKHAVANELYLNGYTTEEIDRLVQEGEIGPEEAEHYKGFISDVTDEYLKRLNDELEHGEVAQVVDPRDGRTEVRATSGTDRRVVTAYKDVVRKRDKARSLIQNLSGRFTRSLAPSAETAKAELLRRINRDVTSVAEEFVAPHEFGRALVSQSEREEWARIWGLDASKVRGVLGENGLLDHLLKALRSEDLPRARRVLGSRETTLIRKLSPLRKNPILAQLSSRLVDLRKDLDAFAKIEPKLKAYDQSRKTLTDLMDRHPSAEYQPRLQEILQQRTLEWLSEHETEVEPEDLDVLYDMVGNQEYRGQLFKSYVGETEMLKITQSATKTLVTERDNGFRPRFAFTVHPEALPRLHAGQASFEAIAAPEVKEGVVQPRPISAAKSRSKFGEPLIHDPVLGLVKHDMEILEHKFNTEYWFGENGWITQRGMDYDAVRSEVIQSIKAVPETSLVPRGASLSAEIAKRYVKINPGSLFPTSRAISGGVNLGKEVFLERGLYNAIKANIDAFSPAKNVATREYLAGTKLFKYSLLNFSPRYIIGHIGGGGAMLLALRTPLTSFLSLPGHLSLALGMTVQDHGQWLEWASKPGARQMLKPVLEHFQRKAELAGEKGLPGELQHTTAEIDTTFMENRFSYNSGAKVGSLLTRMMNARGMSAGLHLANIIANMERALAYSIGGRGEEGIEFAQKVYADFGKMTPAERSLAKYVIPFYPWTRHMLRYAATYPIDHPYRAMVGTQTTTQYWEEWATGLPQKLVYLFTLGKPDSSGNVSVTDLRQLDPLRNVVDIFTLSGAMSALNPAFQTGLQALGIDPVTAQPDNFYQPLTVDQFTGSVTTQRPNPLFSIVNGVFNYIPESNVLDHFLTLSSYTRYLKQNEPALYRQQLWESFNIPWVPYNVNIFQTAAKTETHDFTVAKDLVQSSNSTGAMFSADPNSRDWTALFKYSYVPWNGWMVQPASFRYWVFEQAPITDGNNSYTGYSQYQKAGGTLPPAAVIAAPSTPSYGSNPYAPRFGG